MSKKDTRKTILIVDDDENVRVLCERELGEQGYITHSVSSGMEALHFMDKNPQVDLVILDVKMPSLSGVQVLKRLRARKVNVPVILYSDYSDYVNDLLSLLANSYLMKSADLTELKEKVKELLGFET